MQLTWQNAFEELTNKDQQAEMFAYYDEALNKTSINRIEFYSLISRFAAILRASGVQRGDVILCALPLCPEAAVINFGAMFAGVAIVHNEYVPSNPALFLHILKQSTAKYVVMRPESFDDTWQEMKDKTDQRLKSRNLFTAFSDARVPAVQRAIIIQRGGDMDFLQFVRSYGGVYVDRELSEDQMAAMYLTSGTTGMPKLVIRSHKSLVLDAQESVVPEEAVPKGFAKRFFHNGPWSWAVSSSFDLLSGYTRVHPDLWHKPTDTTRLHVNILKKDDTTCAFFTPPEMEAILKTWDDPNKKPTRVLMIAGFPVTKELCKWMLPLADKLVVRFGCSEMISICYNVISKPEDFKNFDCGALYPRTTVRAVDENMKDVPKGRAGRLLLRSHSMFDGYMGQPEKTVEALSGDGWFMTSDAGYLDEDKHLFIIGRYDYVIKTKTGQYYPSTIETKIQEDSRVKDVVVVPVPSADDKNYHTVCAYIVKETGVKICENDVINSVANAAATQNGGSGLVAPKHIFFVDAIERNPRGKINRNKLIEDAVKMIKTKG